MVIVSRQTQWEAAKRLLEWEDLGLDTETYGVKYDDPMFSLIIGNDVEQFYFNFNTEPDHLGTPIPENYILDQQETIEILWEVFSMTKLWYMHNAKFDMRRLQIAGAELAGDIHDTEVTERLIKNNLFSYSLKMVAYRHGAKKDDAVEEYITKHKLYTQVEVPGKATKVKEKHFDKVPFEIITKYGCVDAKIVHTIGRDQRRVLGIL